MRIITRGDFDGLSSTVLLTDVETVESIKMVHPKDAQDGKVPADEQDIVVNLPPAVRAAGCGSTTTFRKKKDSRSHVEFKAVSKSRPVARA